MTTNNQPGKGNCFILSCEHGGGNIPMKYRLFFEEALNTLEIHRIFDYGALSLYHQLKNEFTGFSHHSTDSRLLVDLNRTLEAPSLFSEFEDGFSQEQKLEILNEYYHPYRNRFIQYLNPIFERGSFVVHVSVHSFTPILDGVERNADIGILFDPAFQQERRLAQMWKWLIHKEMPQLKVRFNYPYLGKTDGHVVYYRRRYPNQYAGLELELNYRCVDDPVVLDVLAHTYRELCTRWLKLTGCHLVK